MWSPLTFLFFVKVGTRMTLLTLTRVNLVFWSKLICSGLYIQLKRLQEVMETGLKVRKTPGEVVWPKEQKSISVIVTRVVTEQEPSFVLNRFDMFDNSDEVVTHFGCPILLFSFTRFVRFSFICDNRI